MNDYLPILRPIPGTNAMHEDLSDAHARRQSDAAAAIAEVGEAKRLRVMTVWCASRKRHMLAEVFKTAKGNMIIVHQDKRDDLDVIRLRREWAERDSARAIGLGMDPDDAHAAAEVIARELRHTGGKVTDVLDAPDDFDLEASCTCGYRRLDRAAIREAVAAERSVFVV